MTAVYFTELVYLFQFCFISFNVCLFLFWHPKETPTQTIQTLEPLETDTPSLNKNINHCMSYDKFYFVLTEVLSVLLYGSMSLDWPSGYLKDRKCAIYLNSAAQLNLYASLLEKKQTWKSLMPVYSHDSTLWFNISPERLISVRESLVVVPAAVSRLTDWSLIWLQYLRSSLESKGICRLMRRKDVSVMSSPANLSSSTFRNLQRLSSWPVS